MLSPYGRRPGCVHIVEKGSKLSGRRNVRDPDAGPNGGSPIALAQTSHRTSTTYTYCWSGDVHTRSMALGSVFVTRAS